MLWSLDFPETWRKLDARDPGSFERWIPGTVNIDWTKKKAMLLFEISFWLFYWKSYHLIMCELEAPESQSKDASWHPLQEFDFLPHTKEILRLNPNRQDQALVPVSQEVQDHNGRNYSWNNLQTLKFQANWILWVFQVPWWKENISSRLIWACCED